MTRRMLGRRSRAILSVLVALPLLAGCTGPDPYSDFERAPDERDVLPDFGTVADGLDPESIRYAGSAEGVEVYLATPLEGDGQCVITDGIGGPMAACGRDVEVDRPGEFVVKVHADGEAPDDVPGLEWTALGENVSVRLG